MNANTSDAGQFQPDPNSQPAQPITPPTGQAERNLTPTGHLSPTASAKVGAPVNAEATRTPQRGKENANRQPKGNANDNENDNTSEATPTPTPRNKRLPADNSNDEPPPPPAKKKQPKPEATPDKPPLIDDAPPV